MAYHIIPPGAYYRSRRVRCYESGRYHRHQSHEEEYCFALCGKEVVRGRDDYCNLSIANPVVWSYDWCRP